MTRLVLLSVLFLDLFASVTAAEDTIVLEQRTQADAIPATLKLAGMFADRMVFQRECDAAIWGTAGPTANVTVAPSWSETKFQTTADGSGKWKTKIKTPIAGGPHQVVVSSGKDSIKLKDVLVGEVWICSGQSNMQWKLRGFGSDHFKEDVDKATFPQHSIL